MKKIQLGVVGVDSGQLIVVDPCYIDSEWKDEKLEFEADGTVNAKNNFSYPAVCQRTLGPQNGEEIKENSGQLNYKIGHPGIAVAFPSGYGDGCYPVYGTFNDEGRCVKVEIDCGITEAQTELFEHETKTITKRVNVKRQGKKGTGK